MLSPSLKGVRMDAGIWGFIGVLVGAASSIVTTLLVARNASTERSKESQRNNLIELQDSLTVAMRLTVRITNLDENEKELTEVEKAELTKELMTANQSLATRTERIVDQSLRESVYSLHTDMTGVVLLKIRDPNNEILKSLSDLFKEVTKSVGVALRSLY
jgi:hypothetical protein